MYQGTSKFILITSILSLFVNFFNIGNANATQCLNSQYMDTASGNATFETCGGDDVTYRIPITVPIVFGGVTYTDAYATTNSVVTLGTPDANYSGFPVTPSVSLQANDWVERGWNNNNGNIVNSDEFFNVTTIPNGFQVDLLARTYSEYGINTSVPGVASNQVFINDLAASVNNQFFSSQARAYYQSYLDHIQYYNANNQSLLWSTPVRNTFAFHINPDGTLTIVTFTSSTDIQYRNGCVLSPGATAVTLEECGVLQAVSVENILELIAQVDAELGATDMPIQQSSISSSTFELSDKSSSMVKLVVNGNFVEQMVNIDVNGRALAQGDWAQTPSTITLTVPREPSDQYTVVLYDVSVPMLTPQTIVVSQK
jgi:hypothetical protein